MVKGLYIDLNLSPNDADEGEERIDGGSLINENTNFHPFYNGMEFDLELDAYCSYLQYAKLI